MEPSETIPEKWRIDRNISIAIIVMLLVQFSGVVYWGASMQYTMADHERRLINQETSRSAERMASIEARMQSYSDLQIEMNRKLDKLIDRELYVKQNGSKP